MCLACVFDNVNCTPSTLHIHAFEKENRITKQKAFKIAYIKSNGIESFYFPLLFFLHLFLVTPVTPEFLLSIGSRELTRTERVNKEWNRKHTVLHHHFQIGFFFNNRWSVRELLSLLMERTKRGIVPLFWIDADDIDSVFFFYYVIRCCVRRRKKELIEYDYCIGCWIYGA